MSNKQSVIMSILLAIFTAVVIYFLFHFNHKYAAKDGKVTVMIFSNNEFEVGETINYHSTDFGEEEGPGVFIDATHTATITKVLR